MVGLDDSLDKASSGLLLPRRFPQSMEAEYRDFSLRVFLPGIRAWHTAALCLALVVLLIGTVLYTTGASQSVLPLTAACRVCWSGGLSARRAQQQGDRCLRV